MKKHEQEKDTDLTQETAESGEKAKNKHGKLYYIIVAACALVLVAAIVLMAVFLAPSGGSDVIDDPGGQEKPDDPDDPRARKSCFRSPLRMRPSPKRFSSGTTPRSTATACTRA